MKASPATTGPGPRRRQHPTQEEDAEPGGEEDGAQPESLGHPGGDPERRGETEEGAHREQVADVLVVHRSEADRRIPHEATWDKKRPGSR